MLDQALVAAVAALVGATLLLVALGTRALPWPVRASALPAGIGLVPLPIPAAVAVVTAAVLSLLLGRPDARLAAMSRFDFSGFSVLTFDCYGTLIDWEAGILEGLREVLGAAGDGASDDDLLERYAVAEAAVEAGGYLRYREVLARSAAEVCRGLGVEPGPDALAAFGGSVGAWPAFPDSVEALARLRTRYRLAVITNCDDDLFAASNRRLGVAFDHVITAQQVGSYKPDARNFEVAFDRIGEPRERILHVAQSLFHDHVTAKRLGLATAWIDRRHGRSGGGATPPADVTPDLAVPSMAAFAELALA